MCNNSRVKGWVEGCFSGCGQGHQDKPRRLDLTLPKVNKSHKGWSGGVGEKTPLLIKGDALIPPPLLPHEHKGPDHAFCSCGEGGEKGRALDSSPTTKNLYGIPAEVLLTKAIDQNENHCVEEQGKTTHF